jgi:addiction module RelE/StbE family toxin
MRIRWTPAAAADLKSIADYLEQHLPAFAHSTVDTIYQTIVSLKSMPNRGRHGREAGTRELVIPGLPYIVVYWIKDDSVEVLHIHHGARQRGSALGDA